MFGMKKTSELDRLRAVYAEQTDNELLRLYDAREGLTEAARQALDEVMQQRGLERKSPEAVGFLPMPQPSINREEFEEGLSPDEAELWTFLDTYQLQSLLSMLEESGIAFRLLDYHQYQWAGLRSRQQTGVTVIVKLERERE